MMYLYTIVTIAWYYEICPIYPMQICWVYMLHSLVSRPPQGFQCKCEAIVLTGQTN